MKLVSTAAFSVWAPCPSVTSPVHLWRGTGVATRTALARGILFFRGLDVLNRAGAVDNAAAMACRQVSEYFLPISSLNACGAR